MGISVHPVATPAAVPVNTLAEETINPADDGINVHVAGGASGSQSTPDVSVDQGISFVAAGNVNCTTAAQLTAQTGVGYIIVTNLDTSNVVYLGGSGVSGGTNGEALPAGQSRSWRSANLALEYAIGSATVNASVRR